MTSYSNFNYTLLIETSLLLLTDNISKTKIKSCDDINLAMTIINIRRKKEKEKEKQLLLLNI